jgi:hypothetical protein
MRKRAADTNVDIDILDDDLLVSVRSGMTQTFVAVERTDGDYTILLFDDRASMSAWKKKRAVQRELRNECDVIEINPRKVFS